MATVTITLTDTDLDAGQFKADMNVEDHNLDDGFVTASHVTALFFIKMLKDPEFQKRCNAFAYDLIAGREDATVNEPVPYNDDDHTKAA